MRDGITSTEIDLVSRPTLTTAYAARLEFQSETIFMWTGAHPIEITGSGDTLLDGNRFEPLVAGIMVDVGENTYSYSGSDEFTISLAIPASPSTAISAASV